jgi:ATP-dependent Clp protease ATP-binding subunit ClpA
MFERYTERARRVLFFARYEASQLGSISIETEHLLLGLIREGEGVAAQVLVKLGADRSRVRQQVIQLLTGYGGGMEPGARTQLVRMTMPEDLRQANDQLARVRREKEEAIDRQDFERAAALRDAEKQLLTRLAKREQEWTAGVELEAVIQENHNLHREVERLRELLRQQGIEPDGGTTQTA